MKKLLHIIASPREEESRTLQVANAFLNTLQSNRSDWLIDELNLAKEELPSLHLKQVSGKYVLLGGKELFGRFKEAWAEIEQHIERFKSADLYLISTPMWNYSIPYMLKHYIDVIVQPRYLFRYRKDGSVEGLVQNRKMIVISSRGGAYEGPSSALDYQEPYLRTIFGMVGINDMTFIKAEPMDMGEAKRQEKLEAAKKAATDLARKIDA